MHIKSDAKMWKMWIMWMDSVTIRGKAVYFKGFPRIHIGCGFPQVSVDNPQRKNDIHRIFFVDSVDN